jgi:LuxR family maltose regulon positive regulatory protein
MPEAHRLRELARAEAAWSGSSGAVLAHLLTHAAICLAISGDRTGAMAAARERARRHAPHIGTWGRYVTAALVVRITAACGDAEALREALQDCTALAAELRAAGLAPDERMTLPAAAQLAWLEGRPAAAIDIWRTALGNEEAIDFYGQAAETRVRLARAQWRARNPAAAAATLAPALAVARERGGAGGALLAGEALCELAEAPWASALAAADVALLRAWARACDAGPARAAPPESGLSARELEVLERIAAGDSNKLIARALDLSLHTVKRHVANILGKLGAETRGQAAALFNARQR